MPEELTKEEVAARYHVSIRTVQRWIKSGKLQASPQTPHHYLIQAGETREVPHGYPRQIDTQEPRQDDSKQELQLQTAKKIKVLIRFYFRHMPVIKQN